MKFDNKSRQIIRFLELCLNMAEIIDGKAEKSNWTDAEQDISTRDMGLGYRAWSSHLRDGVRAVVDMQEELHEIRLIRHLDSIPDDTEDPTEHMICPDCAYKADLPWDAKEDGYQVNCPRCGHVVMLCDACKNAEDNPLRRCDWTNAKCFRSKEASNET